VQRAHKYLLSDNPRDTNSSPSSTNTHNQDKNSSNDDDCTSDQVGEYRDNQDDRSSSPESQNASNASISDGDSDHGGNYPTPSSSRRYAQPRQTSSVGMGEEVDMDIGARGDPINNGDQGEGEEDAVGLGLNPRHGFDHLNSDNTQHSLRHSLSQDSFQYPLQQPSRDEESRSLYLYHHQPQISPILSSSSDMDYPTSSAPNTTTIMNHSAIPTNLLLNIPEIVVTEAEPQIKSPTVTRSNDTNPYAQQNAYYPNPTSPTSLYGHHHHHHHHGNFRGGEEEGSPVTENVPYEMNSRGMGQEYVATPLISAGYGSIPSMVFRMNFGG